MLTLVVGFLLVEGVWGAGEQAVITGDQLELRDQGQVTIFIGHVRMTHGDSVMTADRMTQEKATGMIHAEGHVHLLTSAEPDQTRGGAGEPAVINAFGELGLYDQRHSHGRLWDKAWLTREIPGRPHDRMKMTAKVIELWRPERQLLGHESVRIEGQNSWATGQESIYYEADHRVVLTGGPPVVFEETSDGTHLGRGETVTLWPETRRVLLVGQVHGTFQSLRKS